MKSLYLQLKHKLLNLILFFVVAHLSQEHIKFLYSPSFPRNVPTLYYKSSQFRNSLVCNTCGTGSFRNYNAHLEKGHKTQEHKYISGIYNSSLVAATRGEFRHQKWALVCNICLYGGKKRQCCCLDNIFPLVWHCFGTGSYLTLETQFT